MASVSSLDQDMRKLRMDRYTPQAANEVRSWIESTLGEPLQSGDLLDALKDGVALCKLANLVLPPPGVKYKASSMPFTQRENISQFLTVCERPPLNLPSHDRFLTVDLYDNKDPAQVMQCISAFSRAANAVAPSKVRTAVGPKRAGATSPTRVALGSEGSSAGRLNGVGSPAGGQRAMSPALTGGSNASNSNRNSGATVSSWSKKADEYSSAPAWNIHQYGYMGGASQGNQGINFGARRQITSNAVDVPSLAEKERKRKEQAIEAERQRKDEEEAERIWRAQQDEEDRRTRMGEELRREEEIRRARDREKEELEAERQRWEEEERRWREEEERKKQEEEAFRRSKGPGSQGQPMSRYQSEQLPGSDPIVKASESQRIRELERQLEEAKERERQYQLERGGQSEQRTMTPETPDQSTTSYRRPDTANNTPSKTITPSMPSTPSQTSTSQAPDERAQLHQAWQTNQSSPISTAGPPASWTVPSSRPLPDPEAVSSLQATPQSLRSPPPVDYSGPAPSPSPFTRQLPKPADARATYSSPLSTPGTRTDRYLATSAAPSPQQPRTHAPSEMGFTSTAERAAEDARRVASQKQTKAGGWASKSLLEREMERERERQREWEQQQIAKGGGSGIKGPREMGR